MRRRCHSVEPRVARRYQRRIDALASAVDSAACPRSTPEPHIAMIIKARLNRRVDSAACPRFPPSCGRGEWNLPCHAPLGAWCFSVAQP
jgi:hypothetical protein